MDPSATTRDTRARLPASLLPTVVIGASLAVAAFTVAAAVVMSVIEPVTLPPDIGGEQNQTSESALYLLSFAVLLPLAAIFGPRLADRIAAGPNRLLLSPLAAFLATALLVALLTARICAETEWGDGIEVPGLLAAAWLALAAACLARAARPRHWDGPLRLAADPRLGTALWAVAGLGVVAVALCFTAIESLSVPVLVVGLLLAVVAGLRRLPHVPDLPRWAGRAIDVAAFVGLAFAIPDLIVFPQVSDPPLPFDTEIMRFHQNFILGPANEILGGGAMLVDTASQYGVSSVYLTAGWSAFLGIGYGSFALLDALLTVGLFAGGYAVLRMGGVSRLIACVAMAVGVAALAYNLIFPVGGLPQQGPLRYGIPMLAVVAATFGTWRPQRQGAAWAAQAFAVGLSSIWGFEAFAFTVFTVGALSAFAAWEAPRPERRGLLLRRAAWAAAACIVAHLALVALTLVLRGELPDWGQYAAYLDAFLFGPLGDLTYDIDPWRAGFTVGFGYFLSALALILAVRRRPEMVAANRVRFAALTGVTAYGVVLFSYFVDRSTLLVLPYVCLPLLLAGALWFDFVRRREAGRAPARAATALAIGLAAVVAAASAPQFTERLKTSALGHVVPGGRQPGDSLDRLLNLPPLDTRVPAVERLLDETQPGEGRVAMILSPDLATEVMLRSERATSLALAYPWGDSFIASERTPGIREAVADLEAGDRLLLDDAAVAAFAQLQREPDRDPIAYPTTLGPLAPVQEFALQEIGRRFDLRNLAREDQYVAVELVPRSGAATS